MKPRRAREYWKKMMRSTRRAMSRGAQNINRIISWARSDNWRRKDKKQRGRDLGHKSRER